MEEPDPDRRLARHRRKIMPFEQAGAANAHFEKRAEHERRSREKAASLNQHVLGHGTLVEAEWCEAGIPDPDLGSMRRYRLERIRAELRRHDCRGASLRSG